MTTPPAPGALDLGPIRARREAITPGEWIAVGSAVKHAQGYFWWTLSDAVDESHNADFIAHAPADVAALVAEVEALRAQIGRHFLDVLLIESKVDVLLKELGVNKKFSDFKFEWGTSGKEA